MRLAYSALVDADTLDTEAHRLGGVPPGRGSALSIRELLARFSARYEERFGREPATRVNRVRRDVYNAATASAGSPPGLFRLTVPTGGGKTLAGMAFALRHAAEHGLRRVVVAVPFTTITEQTVRQYRDILGVGDGVVLEHHSAAVEDTPDDAEDDDPSGVWARLAAENWDAPIVVTTTVQLFDSLFSNKRNRMRKLHNLARSVIVIDEAQALPTGLLAPILDGVKRLVANAGSSAVLSTATQPAFDALPEFRGLEATEIVPGHAMHFQALDRVDYDGWRIGERHEWGEVAGWLRGGRWPGGCVGGGGRVAAWGEVAGWLRGGRWPGGCVGSGRLWRS
jgi:CRISPR-associated endonuclease/helicase Cas3